MVSCAWSDFWEARSEILAVLKEFGDASASAKATIAKGIIGVETKLDSRSLIGQLNSLFRTNPQVLRHTSRWVPIDAWTSTNIYAIREVVKQLAQRIERGEKWRMTVEKRRYTKQHKIDIIKQVADLIEAKVNLASPDKILWLEMIGSQVGLAVLRPSEIFSVSKAGFTAGGFD